MPLQVIVMACREFEMGRVRLMFNPFLYFSACGNSVNTLIQICVETNIRCIVLGSFIPVHLFCRLALLNTCDHYISYYHFVLQAKWCL